MADELHIRTFCLGEWQTNCYVAHPAGAADCWLIDAGFGAERMVEAIRQARLEPQMLVLTHAHVDHIGGVYTVREAWPELPIAIHRAEAEHLTNPELNLSGLIEMPTTAPPADRLLEHGEELTLGGLRFEVRHTAGHSPGGITLYQPDNAAAFVGDALFAGSVGRFDFPTSDGATLFASIRDQLLTLPNETTIYPGHGPPTTIGQERQTNPFL